MLDVYHRDHVPGRDLVPPYPSLLLFLSLSRPPKRRNPRNTPEFLTEIRSVEVLFVMGSTENPNWLLDCSLIDDIPVAGGDFTSQGNGFSWAPQAFNGVSNVGVEIDECFADSDSLKDLGSRKRVRSESCSVPASKACREKLRRDRLNDRFLELGSILEPGKPPKMDKAVILSDAVRMMTQLRTEAQKLKDSNGSLQEKIKELKAEKNELRDEKQRLKAEKDNLEQQIKAMSMRPSFVSHPPVMPTPFAVQGQTSGNKLMMPVIGYPGFQMWQYMPPADVDTSQDVAAFSPVA